MWNSPPATTHLAPTSVSDDIRDEPTSASSSASTSSTAARGDRRRRPHPADRAFNLLLLAAERGRHVGLTVSVNGSVVSGRLVGAVEYFRALADEFMGSEGSTGMDELFAESFRNVVDDAHRSVQDALTGLMDGTDAERTVEFLHLTDARYVSGSAFLPHGRHGVLWRCRVSDVSGWSMGDLLTS